MDDQIFQIERKRLADQVADRLIELIAEGRLKPGDRLPSETELMRQFQVGRSSIREAVGALSLIGLVTVKPGQGTHVADFSVEGDAKRIGLIGIGREKIREIVEARIELECIIVRLAAERASAGDIADIRASHDRLRQAMSRHEDPTSADLEFHLAVARACRNSVLIRFLMELRQPIWHWMKQKAKYDWGYAQVYDQHEAILRAIEQRDAKTAEEAVKSHLRSAGERLITSIHEGEAEPPAPSSSR
ncbi:MAG: FadR family transcriptional regulator [Desulfofustis sp.]|jgi:GntR family transcriptional repressor for pyruvate dehydrogenase complex|nr:FadR family transcriptional regulator [Desulfofustis sp.]